LRYQSLPGKALYLQRIRLRRATFAASQSSTWNQVPNSDKRQLQG
jgi:hypothetical protein